MSRATAMGGGRHALKMRKDDLYETPRCATLALLRCERLPHWLWEPCAGRGAIASVLHENGHSVYAHDLVTYDNSVPEVVTGRDFLMERSRPLFATTIVTNPPFKLADEFIRHGLDIGCEVIVLLRLMALEGASRSDLIDKHLVRVWAGIERLPMMHREGWAGVKQGNSGAPFAWFVFSAKPRGYAPIELRRMSWRTA